MVGPENPSAVEVMKDPLLTFGKLLEGTAVLIQDEPQQRPAEVVLPSEKRIGTHRSHALTLSQRRVNGQSRWRDEPNPHCHRAHASYFFMPDAPVNGAGSRDADDPALRALIRVYMANRRDLGGGWLDRA